MTALRYAMATRNWVLTTATALERARCQAEFDGPAADPAPFLSCVQRSMDVSFRVRYGFFLEHNEGGKLE